MACGKALLASLMIFILICNSAEGFHYRVLTDPYIMGECPKIPDCPGDYIVSWCRRYQIITLADGIMCRDCPINVCGN
ncbi:hypothetical protein KP79_PYT18918 [Mizuhopecten yessoensis]|uniref:Uncharacterized protein n=1 Tax=Mizuhopecten yessoensis TaxID=6573 RepID=A0A210QZN1_MIZYE|nr:hypothetical protein KP79_PYT18918 [Mizuhopecten yessoensis]